MPILWWCLSAQDQAKLMKFAWENYGYRLTIPPFPIPQLEIKASESFEELERSLKQRPYGLKRVY